MPPEEDPNEGENQNSEGEGNEGQGGDSGGAGSDDMVPRSQLQQAIKDRQDAKARAKAAQTRYDDLIAANDGQPLTVEEIQEMREAKKAAAAADEEAAKKRGDFDELMARTTADHKKALEARDTKYHSLHESYRTEKLGVLAGKLLVKNDVLPEAADTAQENLINVGDVKQGVRMEFVQDAETKKWEARLTDIAGNVATDEETGDALTFDTFMERHKKNHPYFYRAEVQAGSGTGSDSTSTDTRSTLQEQMDAALAAEDHDRYRELSNKLFGLSRK